MFEFPAENEVKETSEFAFIEPGTEVVVKPRLRDGQLEIRQGQGKNKPWMSVPFVIVGGEHDGRYCSLMLTVDPHNKYFRRDVSVMTGVDVSQGARMSQEDFEEKVLTGQFRAIVASEKRPGRDGTEKHFVNVTEMLERMDAPAEEPAPSIPVDDSDIPF